MLINQAFKNHGIAAFVKTANTTGDEARKKSGQIRLADFQRVGNRDEGRVWGSDNI